MRTDDRSLGTSSRSSLAKGVLATLLLLIPTALFFAMSDRGDAGWTAQSQIFHGGVSRVETETEKLNSVGMLQPAADAEGITVDQLLEGWEAGAVDEDFFVADRPDTQLLKLEFTSTDPSQAVRVVTDVTNRYVEDASPFTNLDVVRQRFLELEAAQLEGLDGVRAELETLEPGSLAHDDAQLSLDAYEAAIVAVRAELTALDQSETRSVGSEVIASPFLLPKRQSNALRQTILGFVLGVLLAGSFLLLVRMGGRRATESRVMQSANVPEAPQAFPRSH